MTRKRRQRRPLTEAQQGIRDRIEQCNALPELIAIGDEYTESEPVLAARAYRKALKLQPQDGVLLNNLGVAYWNMGNHGEALPLFEKARALLPEDANVVNNLAGALLNNGRQDKARHWFRQASKMTPGKHTFLACVDLHGY